jgi:uncharacterized membrane protein
MDPIIFEFLGGLLVGAMAGLMVVLRIKHPAPKMMPMLAVKRTRSARLVRRRKTSRIRDRSTVTFAKRRKKAKTKAPDAMIPSSPTLNTLPATASFDTCPSCGLQAPGSLLAEHFLGSPSHKNGPPKIVKADIVEVAAVEEAKEEDSKQSVRNLLQMLVPPRAFGRRHAHRSMGPISSIVKDLGPPHRRLP